MSDATIEELARRLERVEQFLRRQGFDKPYGAIVEDGDAAEAARVAALATMPATIQPTLPPAIAPARPPAMPPPMPVGPITHADPSEAPLPIAAVVARDDPRFEPGPRPNLSVAAPLEPHVPDDRGYPIPAADFDRIYGAPAPAAAAPAVARSEPTHLPPPMPRRDAGGLEQLVGLKLAGWVGAIVLVIGAALGVKFAYDQGWLGGLPNSVRLGLLYAVGFAVIGAGEWVYRRVGDLASAGVFGAGVAILFVVGYAGDAYFDLYGQRVAFALMAGASAIGAIVAWRARLASIAVLSILGANLAPMLLGRSAAGESTLLVYLLALQLLALLLAHVGDGERWWSLRGVSLATTAFWVAVRLVDPSTRLSTPTVLFTIAYALIFHVEAALAARKAAWSWMHRHGTFATFSTTVTALLTLAVLVWTDDWPDRQVGATLLGMAMCFITTGGAGLAIGAKSRHAGGERTRVGADDSASDVASEQRHPATNVDGRAWRELAVSWLGQGMALVAVAVPVALDGPWVLVGWMALALVYASIGVYTRRPASVVAGALVWAFAVAHLAIFSYASLARATVFAVGGVAITQALLAGIALWMTGHAIAALLGSRRLDAPSGWFGRMAPGVREAMPFLATVVVAVVIYATLPPLAATVGFALLAWATLGVARVDGRRDLHTGGRTAMLAVGFAVLSLLKWLLIDALSVRLGGNGPAPARAIFNTTMAVGVGVAASMVALVWVRSSVARAFLPVSGVTPPEDFELRPNTDRNVGATGIQIERLVAVFGGLFALAIALAAELDAAATAAVARSASPHWRASQIACLLQTGLALLIAAIAWPLTRAIAPTAVDARRVRAACGWAVFAVAVKFVVVDTLGFAFNDELWLAMPLANGQFALAAAIVVACVVVARRAGPTNAGQAAGAMAAVVPLVAGSVEIARAVGPERTLVALSVFWAAYAAAAIAVGFAIRGGLALRIGGLALLAITIAKVVLVDLASAGTGLRILSFLAVGVLLLATSVLYGKFGQQLMRREEDASPGFEVDR